MQQKIFDQLFTGGFVSQQQVDDITQFEKTKPVSLHRDLRVLLYAGILLLTSGLSIFIYKNIDSIGHLTIIILTGIGCLACLGWCLINGWPFSTLKIQSPSVLFDYILLLGCLLLLTFVGYIQFRYQVFGSGWRLASFTTMILLFLSAYYFDHLGVLSLAITNLATWAGLVVTPLQILQSNDFDNGALIYTGMVLGAGLALISFVSIAANIKNHFAFTYKNFGVHILLVSCLAGMLHFDYVYLWFFIVLAPATILFFTAITERNFYFIVVTILYAYIALCTVVFHAFGDFTESHIYIILIYLILSGIGLIRALMYYNKLLQTK